MFNSAARSAAPIFTDLSSAEALLQTMLEVSLSSIVLLRPVGEGDEMDFSIEYINPAGQRMLKMSERPGEMLSSRFPQTQKNGVLEFYRRAFKSGQQEHFNVNYQQDGLDNFFQVSVRRSGSLLVVSLTDKTEEDRSDVEQALRESQTREQAARAEADLQRQQLHNIFMQAPALICIFEGPNHIFKLVNPHYQQLVGDRPILGKPIAEAMPELEGQPIFSLLDNVYQSGESFFAHEMMVQLDHNNSGGDLGQNYYNFVYQAMRNLAGEIEGIMVFAYEVTAQVRARKEVELSHQKVQELNKELETRVIQRTQALQQAQTQAELQKQRLERLFMQAPAAISIFDGPELVFELVNPAYQALFPGRQLLGKPLLEALPEITDHAVYHTFRNVYDTGQTHAEFGLLIPLMRPEDGKLEDRFFNFIQQARHNEQGEIDGVLVFAFEVTVHIEAQKAIEASARQLKLITDALPVLIGYLDKEEKYRFANQAYKAWFNKDPALLLGSPVKDVVGEAAYNDVKKHIDRALAGERVEFDARMPYRENFVKHIHTSYIPDVQDGKVEGFYTLVTDVTEQVENQKSLKESEQQATKLATDLATTNEELQLANEQLIRTNIDLDNFIYAASHDLKAPISNIEGLLQILLRSLQKEGNVSERTEHLTSMMQNSVERFKRTIVNLTEVVKLQKDNEHLVAPLTLSEVINDVMLDLQPMIESSGATIDINLGVCPPIHFSDKNLRSVVYNILSNALKYRSPKRVPVIQLSCKELDSYVMLSVKDNGLGMHSTDETKVFGMFSRLHDHVEGSGIGLYMVRKMLQNAGGKIEVESQVDVGSTFKVYFKNLDIATPKI